MLEHWPLLCNRWSKWLEPWLILSGTEERACRLPSPANPIHQWCLGTQHRMENNYFTLRCYHSFLYCCCEEAKAPGSQPQCMPPNLLYRWPSLRCLDSKVACARDALATVLVAFSLREKVNKVACGLHLTRFICL